MDIYPPLIWAQLSRPLLQQQLTNSHTSLVLRESGHYVLSIERDQFGGDYRLLLETSSPGSQPVITPLEIGRR